MYEPRFYRCWQAGKGLSRFQVCLKESDLWVAAERDLHAEALAALADLRRDLEPWAQGDFLRSLHPVAVPHDAPPVVRAMAEAGRAWQVGPMAAVAGVTAQAVAEALAVESPTVVVENGGDIYGRSMEPLKVGLYAGPASPFTNRLALIVDGSQGVAVCTSSGTVGHSTSLGRADAVVVVHPDGAYADAAATALANEVQGPDDVDRIIERAEREQTLTGLVACAGDRVGFWGDIEITRTARCAVTG
jgi:ApbE superfamily uncharacterized protein (UPF0280 family)